VAAVILRISRARVNDFDEAAVLRVLRTAASEGPRPDGLKDVSVGRVDSEKGTVELVFVSLWTDSNAVQDAFGSAWDHPSSVPSLGGRLTHRKVEHLPVIGSGWAELMA
jgi:heme-degrading monooxygenase HmoA